MNKLNHQPNSKSAAGTKRGKKQEGLEVVPQPTKEHAGLEVMPQKPQKATAKVARQCEHIMINGEFCRAAALRGRKHCYFHLVHIGRRLRAERIHEIAMSIGGDSSVLPTELPLLEDANSIQLALSHIIDDVLHNRLDNKRAGLILYALQTASRNLANGVDFSHKEDATVARSYDDLEQDYQLGDTAPELRVEEAEEEPVDESSVAQGDPRIPKEGMCGALGARVERDAPSQRLEVIPAAHMQGRKAPVFAFVQREVSG